MHGLVGMKIFFWGIILVALVIGCNSQPESGYAIILKEQNARYPAMEAEDWYKLVHQSVFGAGHAIQNEEAARDRLIREWEDLDTVSNEPLVEILGPDSMYARVNLRLTSLRVVDLTSFSRLSADGEPWGRTWRWV